MRPLERKDLMKALIGLGAGALVGRALHSVDKRETAIGILGMIADYDQRVANGTLNRTKIRIPGGRRVTDAIIELTSSLDPRDDWRIQNRMVYADNPLINVFQVKPSALSGLWYKRVEWTQIIQTSRGGISRNMVLTELVGLNYLFEPPKYRPKPNTKP